MIGRAHRLALVASTAFALACAPGPEPVTVRVAVLGDDPFLGADALVLRLETTEGARVSETTLPGSARDFVLGPLDYGGMLRLTLETRRGSLPLGRGRSFSFTVGADGARMGRADVTLGVLGRHAGLPGEGPDGVTCVAPTASGALLTTATSLVPFHAHDAEGLPAFGPPIALPDARVGAAFVPLGGGLLAIGGAEPGVTFFDAQGAVIVERTASAATSGVAVASISRTSVVVAGGIDASGALLDEVVRLDLIGTALELTPLEPLPIPRTGARAFAVEAMGTTGAAPRAIIVDGRDGAGPRTDVVVVDPTGVAITTASALDVPRGAAIAAIEVGQIAVAGGTRGDGTIDDALDVYFLDETGVLEVLSPAPPRLFRGRTGALALLLGRGVVLLVGGADAGGALDDVEIADLRVLRGRVFFTGALPAPSAAPAGALLDDGTVLVTRPRGASLYFPPLP